MRIFIIIRYENELPIYSFVLGKKKKHVNS